MHYTGILIGIASFAVIGIFHPIVTKGEYYLGKRIWPLFLVGGLASLAGAVFIGNVLQSAILAILGFTMFWSILELFEQEKRVEKGWFPANPKRQAAARKYRVSKTKSGAIAAGFEKL
ncbi:MAG: DUF4491 family protein [Oscillospiraceae bacterium]|nr:DUF4491 family protein [Oscillospiraceae bacterium]